MLYTTSCATCCTTRCFLYVQLVNSVDPSSTWGAKVHAPYAPRMRRRRRRVRWGSQQLPSRLWSVGSVVSSPSKAQAERSPCWKQIWCISASQNTSNAWNDRVVRKRELFFNFSCFSLIWILMNGLGHSSRIIWLHNKTCPNIGGPGYHFISPSGLTPVIIVVDLMCMICCSSCSTARIDDKSKWWSLGTSAAAGSKHVAHSKQLLSSTVVLRAMITSDGHAASCVLLTAPWSQPDSGTVVSTRSDTLSAADSEFPLLPRHRIKMPNRLQK